MKYNAKKIFKVKWKIEVIRNTLQLSTVVFTIGFKHINPYKMTLQHHYISNNAYNFRFWHHSESSYGMVNLIKEQPHSLIICKIKESLTEENKTDIAEQMLRPGHSFLRIYLEA